MFCTNCGNKIEKDSEFCTKCGSSLNVSEVKTTIRQRQDLVLGNKWWHRLLKVLYIVLYLPLLLIIPIMWSANSSSYTGYFLGQPRYTDTYGKAFWYSLLTLVIYIVILRLIKVAVLYVVVGQKPEWKKEFKKFF